MTTRSETKLSSVFVVLGLMVSGLVFAPLFLGVASARHTSEPQCRVVTGVSRGIPYTGGGGASGIENSGRFHFDVIENINHDLRACTEASADPSLFDIKGFAWNTNLGYMSFRCSDEDNDPLTPLTNRGISCGSIPYGSSVYAFEEGSPYAGERVIVGYVWGENIGWISLACLDFDGDGDIENWLSGIPNDPNVSTNPSLKQDCEDNDIQYGTFLAEDGSVKDLYPASDTQVSSYAYAQSVGWLSLGAATSLIPGSPSDSSIPEGTKFDIPDTTPDITISFEPPDDGDGDSPPDGGGGGDRVGGPNGGLNPLHPDTSAILSGSPTNRAYANGEDQVELSFRILNGVTSVSCDDPLLNNIEVSLDNEVHFNQVDPGSDVIDPNRGVSPVNPSFEKLKYKAEDASRNGYFFCEENPLGTGSYSYGVRFTSTAPTNTANPLRINLITVTYNNESFSLIARNTLPLSYAPSDERGFIRFYEPVEISELGSRNISGTIDTGLGRALFATRNTPNAIRVSATRHISGGTIGNAEDITLDAPFQYAASAPEPDRIFDYFYDQECDGPELPEDLVSGEEPSGDTVRVANQDLDEISVSLSGFGLIGASNGMGQLHQSDTTNEDPCVYAYFSGEGTQIQQPQSAGLGHLVSGDLTNPFHFKVSYNVPLAAGGQREVSYYTLGLNAGQTINQFAQAEGLIKVDPQAFREVIERGTFGPAVEKPVGEELGSSYQLRDNIVRTVAKFSRHPQTLLPDGVSINSSSYDPEREIVITEEALKQDQGNVVNKKFYYFSKKILSDPTIYDHPEFNSEEPFRIVIRASGDPLDPLNTAIDDPNVMTTVACEGCNIFIDSNIQKATPSTPASEAPFLGLITIDDLSSVQIGSSFGPANIRNQGNVYICQTVTETNLATVMDGSIFHYGRNPSDGDPCTKRRYTGLTFERNDISYLKEGDLYHPSDLPNPSSPLSSPRNLPRCSLIHITSAVTRRDGFGEDGRITNKDRSGMPNFENCGSSVFPSDILDNQWTTFGQLASRNCMGCSTFLPPITAEGDNAINNDLSIRSKRQDYNYMRWAKWVDAPYRDFRETGIQYCWGTIQNGIPILSIDTSQSLGNAECINIDNPPENYPPRQAIVNIRFRDSRLLPILGEITKYGY